MSIDRYKLAHNYSISRVIKGGWHLAGGHGKIDPNQAIEDMQTFVRAGITTFDCADIYTGVEELIGKFLRKNREAIKYGELAPVQVHTKYVPDYKALGNIRFEDTARIIERSLKRLGVERLDLVQFAWWTYEKPGYVETALHLKKLQQQGKIRFIGLTNFDGKRVQEILDAGVSVVSNQVQYSVMDQRPAHDMQAIAEAYDIPYLCYGSLAGGFLSDRYLGISDPSQPLENRSLTKYRLIIDEFGGYDFFQEALQTLRKIADKYKVEIAEISARYVLQKPMVASVIIGARNAKHVYKLKQLSSFKLDGEDLDRIAEITGKAQGPQGPVYDLERDKEGKHGRIMKYNLNDA